MLRDIGWRQLERWMAFYALEPWGAEADDGRAAMLTAAVYNTDPRRRRQLRPRDFMPRRGARQTVAEQQAILRAVTRSPTAQT